MTAHIAFWSQCQSHDATIGDQKWHFIVVIFFNYVIFFGLSVSDWFLVYSHMFRLLDICTIVLSLPLNPTCYSYNCSHLSASLCLRVWYIFNIFVLSRCRYLWQVLNTSRCHSQVFTEWCKRSFYSIFVFRSTSLNNSHLVVLMASFLYFLYFISFEYVIYAPTSVQF